MKGKRMGADLVLANIITPVLCELMRALAGQAKKGGTLLFRDPHRSRGGQSRRGRQSRRLKITGRKSKGDWWCLRALK